MAGVGGTLRVRSGDRSQRVGRGSEDLHHDEGGVRSTEAGGSGRGRSPASSGACSGVRQFGGPGSRASSWRGSGAPTQAGGRRTSDASTWARALSPPRTATLLHPGLRRLPPSDAQSPSHLSASEPPRPTNILPPPRAAPESPATTRFAGPAQAPRPGLWFPRTSEVLRAFPSRRSSMRGPRRDLGAFTSGRPPSRPGF